MRPTQTFLGGKRLMTDVPIIIKLPFPCPHCGEEVTEEAGRAITNRQALCGS